MQKVFFYSMLIFLLLTACQSNKADDIKGIDPVLEIVESDGTLSDVVSHSDILEQKIVLTFNGLADEKTMQEILWQLGNSNVKATFFIEGMRVAQDPELVKEIIDKGHDVQNATLSFLDMSKLDYDETYEEIYLANEVFEKHLNYKPQYVRSRSGDISENMRLASAMLEMKGVVGSSINPKDREMQSAEEIVAYIDRFLSSGDIIHLNTYINPAVVDAIPLLVKAVKKKGYAFTTLTDIVEGDYLTKNLEEIEGYDAIQTNLNYENVEPHIYYRKNTTKKEIALTFDDYASEERTREILKILEDYNINSTFFLIGKSAESAPHLAKLILDAGHEVASHSYNHVDVTEMTPEELQEDVVKAHQALTYALQQSPLLYFRPAQGIMDEQASKIISATGMETIALYDITSFDWKKDYTAQNIYDRIMDQVGPGKVIVMHVLDDTKTIEALPLVIKELQNREYTFVKLSSWIEENDEESVD